MTYPREADSRSASRTPVAPGHGAAALQSWQTAVIALLQAGRTPVAACADAHVSIRQFRDSYTHDLLFRDACLAAIAAARGRAHEASPDTRAPSTPRPDSVPGHALPVWAPVLFDVLLKGMPLEAAYKQAGVLAADVRRERQRNLLFRQAFQAVSADGAGGSRRKKYEPLLDRAVADAVVAARVIAPREGEPTPRADWQGALLRALRDGWAMVEAMRIASIDDQAVGTAWDAVTQQRQAEQAQAQAEREQHWRAQQARVAAELGADKPLEEAARAADVSLDVAAVWTATIPAVAEAYAAYQQRIAAR